MYYEIHGTGRPLVVLHGAYMTIGMMGEVVLGLAESRQVIAVELQGHGPPPTSTAPSPTKGWPTTRPPCCGTSGSSRLTSSATAWGAPPPCRSPSATRAWCASSSPPRLLTRATACDPSCTR